VPYGRIAVVDPEGDGRYQMPHLYVEFSRALGPFDRVRKTLTFGEYEEFLSDEWKRVNQFATNMAAPPPARIHRDKKIHLDRESVKALNNFQPGADTLFADDDRYDFLRPRDLIALEDSGAEEAWIQVTSTFEEIVADFFTDYRQKAAASRQLGREPKPEELIRVVEVRRFSKWEVEGIDKGGS
jgi:hypothetical protein